MLKCKEDIKTDLICNSLLGLYITDQGRYRDNSENNRQDIYVGLSNICYTILNKFFQDSLRGFPPQRPHRKQVIVPAIVDLELPGKVLKGIKRMGSVETFIIFAMAALYFSVMPGCERTDQFMPDPMLF